MDSESEKLVRLLIVDEGLHQAEQITSSLRSSGLHVLAEFAEDSEDMCEIILNKSLDIVLFSMKLPDFTLQQVQHLIRECGRHLTVIAMTPEPSEDVMVEAMKDGAQDVVASDALDHLALVIRREADSLRTWRKAVSNDQELHESEKRCQSLLANSKDAVAYVHEGMHIYANEPYLELFGNTDFDELEATPLIDMVHSSQHVEVKKFLRELSQNKTSSNEVQLKLIHKSGETIEGLLECSRASYEGEPCTQILIRSREDTSELEQQINYLHQHDLVTGLYNRQYFMDTLKDSVNEAMNGSRQAIMLYISIDNFQYVRDTVGISGCDILINDVAQILKEFAPQDVLVARFGAYNYTILYGDAEKREVEQSTQSLLKKIEEHISEIGNKSISATCSIAIYHIDENAPNNSGEIISRAERLLDQLQKDGGNQSRVYVPVAGEMTLEEEDHEIVKHIKAAVANNSIEGFFQPIVSIGGITGERYEISKIIHTEDGKELTQEDFLPAAERTGTARTLDRWAIIHSIKLIADEIKKGRKLQIFIPLSCDSVLDASLTRWIAARITSAKIPGEQLVFTINESHAVNQLKAAKTLYKGLKQLHCQVVLDGFGTGLNPFQLVKHLQADYLRINNAYVDGLATNNDNQNSIREITSQASSMEIQCIIPGVQDAGILSVLWNVGADFVQGEFLQAPSQSLNYDFSSMQG
jgi:diguanylate cyclase (GGDEF)-like protein/PAS domain S-box-containing protein